MELSLEQALQKGVAAHKAGDLQQAERLYRAILAAQPNQPDANHNLGVIAVSVNKASAAIPLFKIAVETNPRIEQYWLSYIDALIRAKQFATANLVITQAGQQNIDNQKLAALQAQVPNPIPEDQHKEDAPPEQQINELLSFYQSGQFQKAEQLATLLTQQFPNHQFAWKVLGAVLKNSGRLSESLSASQKSVEIDPHDAEAYNNLGNTLIRLGRFDEAESVLKRALELESDLSAAHCNLGLTYQELDRLEESETSLRRAISLNPNLAEAHYNLGGTLQKINNLEGAERSFRYAIKLRPSYPEALNNLGVTLQSLGRLEEAGHCYIRALEISPDYKDASSNLTAILTAYQPEGIQSQPIVKANEEIRNITLKIDSNSTIADEKVISLFTEAVNIVNSHSIKIETQLSQVYRRNEVDLNCERHKSIFSQYNVIPEFCFSCYKVQVEPRTVLELIKLTLLFDQMELTDNNTRKCMIELRPEVKGFYKGLIYCADLAQAREIAESTNFVIRKFISPKLSAKIKRGCTEYGMSYPEYDVIASSGSQPMRYREEWKAIEDKFDLSNMHYVKTLRTPTLPGINLEDILVFLKWTDYAKGLGDSTAYSISSEIIHFPSVHKLAKDRAIKYVFDS